MKVLWLCNICVPVVAKQLGMEVINKEGWLTGLLNRLLAEQKDVELGICFPVGSKEEEFQKKVELPVVYKDFQGKTEIFCYGFYEDSASPEFFDEALQRIMEEIIEDFNPGIVHIFGMEFAHSLSMTKAVKDRKKLLIGIQGMCTICADVYTKGIPEKKVKRYTLRDFLKKDNIQCQQEKFSLRGKNERQLLSLTGNVTGRTTADKEFAKNHAPQAVYFKMNETLRTSFYSDEWLFERCEENRIFICQADYPIKGLHLFLLELPEIIQKFPKTQVVVGGNQIAGFHDFFHKVKISSYGKYLDELIKKGNLHDHISFTGKLSEEAMKDEYLKANVALCCSITENSPNCVGEAMLLGVPSIASAVGGVPDLFIDEKEGFLYNPFEKGDIVSKVERVFRENGSKEQAERCNASRQRALITHDADNNFNRLIEIYRKMMEEDRQ